MRGLIISSVALAGCVIIPPPTKPGALQPGWYDFSVESATIATGRDNSKAWDVALAGAEPPDVYVEVFIDGQAYRTPTVKNSFQPRWVGSFSALLGRSDKPVEARILVWDRDYLSGDDPIGTTTLDLNQVLQGGGVLKVDSFGYVVNLSLNARFDSPSSQPESTSTPTSLSTTP